MVNWPAAGSLGDQMACRLSATVCALGNWPAAHRSPGQLPVHWSSGRLPVRPFTHGQLAAGPSANWPTDRPSAHWPTGWWPVRPRGCWPVVHPPTCQLVGGPFAPTGQWPVGPLAGGPFAHGRLAGGLSTHWPTGRLPVRPGECCPVAWPPTGQLADGLFTCPLPTGQLAGGPFTHGQLAGGPFTRVK